MTTTLRSVFFGRTLRANLNMPVLFTHRACNRPYEPDEAYFIAAMPIQAMGTMAADAVLQDFARGLAEGRWRSLHKRVTEQFGRVIMADGRVPFHAEFDRLHRVVWKLARGCYFSELRVILPEQSLRTIEIIFPQEAAEKIPNHEWFAYIRDMPSLSHVGGVFDLKMRIEKTPEMSLGILAMLFWDRIIALVAFHDVSCPCSRCADLFGPKARET